MLHWLKDTGFLVSQSQKQLRLVRVRFVAEISKRINRFLAICDAIPATIFGSVAEILETRSSVISGELFATVRLVFAVMRGRHQSIS